VLAAIASHAVTHISATPSFYRLLLPADRPLPGIRSVTLGGESADAGLVGQLHAMPERERLTMGAVGRRFYAEQLDMQHGVDAFEALLRKLATKRAAHSIAT
jgi:hypothetical protein